MKIGIGRPAVHSEGAGQPVDQFVLSRMSENELHLFDQRKPLVAEAVDLFVHEGIDVCMSQVNGR